MKVFEADTVDNTTVEVRVTCAHGSKERSKDASVFRRIFLSGKDLVDWPKTQRRAGVLAIASLFCVHTNHNQSFQALPIEKS